jgi:hypothetical protein
MKITSRTKRTSMNGMTFGSDVSSKRALRARSAKAAIAASLCYERSVPALSDETKSQPRERDHEFEIG